MNRQEALLALHDYEGEEIARRIIHEADYANGSGEAAEFIGMLWEIIKALEPLESTDD